MSNATKTTNLMRKLAYLLMFAAVIVLAVTGLSALFFSK